MTARSPVFWGGVGAVVVGIVAFALGLLIWLSCGIIYDLGFCWYYPGQSRLLQAILLTGLLWGLLLIAIGSLAVEVSRPKG